MMADGIQGTEEYKWDQPSSHVLGSVLDFCTRVQLFSHKSIAHHWMRGQ